MNYNIHITNKAERDLKEAVDYIEFVLKNPIAADNLLDKVDEEISSLSEFPQRFPVVDDRILGAFGVRFVTVNNYLIFFAVDEENQRVNVIRFQYAKRNWAAILKQDFPLQ